MVAMSRDREAIAVAALVGENTSRGEAQTHTPAEVTEYLMKTVREHTKLVKRYLAAKNSEDMAKCASGLDANEATMRATVIGNLAVGSPELTFCRAGDENGRHVWFAVGNGKVYVPAAPENWK